MIGPSAEERQFRWAPWRGKRFVEFVGDLDRLGVGLVILSSQLGLALPAHPVTPVESRYLFVRYHIGLHTTNTE